MSCSKTVEMVTTIMDTYTNNIPKRVLIIGNGFDIAHNLPTRYSDFLHFCDCFMQIFSLEESADLDSYKTKINSVDYKLYRMELYDDLYDIVRDRKYRIESGKKIVYIDNNPILEKIYNDLATNIWYKYFDDIYKKNYIKGQNWIDFEREIRDIICYIDKNTPDLNTIFDNLYQKAIHERDRNEKAVMFLEISDTAKDKKLRKGSYLITRFITLIFNDLRDLTEALEIYLGYFVSKLKVSKLKDIQNINPDYVVSFNYTDTFQRTYQKKTDICYIHGNCRDIDTDKNDFITKECNLVMGIDEYLDDNERNENNRFAIFKKFVQRIRNHNDVTYYQWATDFDEKYENVINRAELRCQYDEPPYMEVYTYGHSLDITDIDVLRMFLKPEWSKLFIYAKDKATEGDLIVNLIKIISEDGVISKASRKPLMLFIKDTSEKIVE